MQAMHERQQVHGKPVRRGVVDEDEDEAKGKGKGGKGKEGGKGGKGKDGKGKDSGKGKGMQRPGALASSSLRGSSANGFDDDGSFMARYMERGEGRGQMLSRVGMRPDAPDEHAGGAAGQRRPERAAAVRGGYVRVPGGKLSGAGTYVR